MDKKKIKQKYSSNNISKTTKYSMEVWEFLKKYKKSLLDQKAQWDNHASPENIIGSRFSQLKLQLKKGKKT